MLARIDAAVFVLPLVAFAPLRRSTRATALAVAGAVGAVYAAYDLLMFGSALPLSSAVKSLGGLQLNHRLLDQMAAEWRTQHLGGRDLQMFASVALSGAALAAAWRRPYARALAGAAVVGDREYLAALKAGGDLTPLLCRRGVRFLLACRPELGAYRVHRMPVLRPALTRRRAPT